MAIANIFQKLRASAPAAAVGALAGFLTLATPFSNATAQEPAVLNTSKPAAATLAAHHNGTATSPYFTRAESPFESAKPDAKNNKRVAFWLLLPQEGRYTPEAAGEILVGQMAKRGVIKGGVANAHSYGTNSPKGGEMEVVVYIGDKVYVSPLTGTSVFDLRSIIPQLDTIAEQYQEIQPSGRVAINKSGPESAP